MLVKLSLLNTLIRSLTGDVSLWSWASGTFSGGCGVDLVTIPENVWPLLTIAACGALLACDTDLGGGSSLHTLASRVVLAFLPAFPSCEGGDLTLCSALPCKVGLSLNFAPLFLFIFVR